MLASIVLNYIQYLILKAFYKFTSFFFSFNQLKIKKNKKNKKNKKTNHYLTSAIPPSRTTYYHLLPQMASSSAQSDKTLVPKHIDNNFTIHKLLGRGGFGMVYSVSHKQAPSQQIYAAKLEKMVKKNGKENKHPQLYYEYRMYRHLQKRMKQINRYRSTKIHILPKIYLFTQIFDLNQKPLNVLVMQRIGANVAKIFSSHDRKFSQCNVVSLGIQMISCIQAVHECNVIHRDIKPENFCVGGSADPDKLYILDFGLSKCYRNRDGSHIPFRTGKTLTGTPRYASINCHEGVEQSRRDDLESFMYMLLFLLKGRLPWQGLRHKNKNDPKARHDKKTDNILIKKRDTAPHKLCEDVHPNFLKLLEYVRSLGFEEIPDYEKLRSLLIQCIMGDGDHKLATAEST